MTSDYQLVILMAGKSNRFQEAGYALPKALLKANSELIINRIIKSFKLAKKILVVAALNQELIIESQRSNIKSQADLEFVFIEQHDLGPSESLLRAEAQLHEELPIVVTYCDFAVEIDDLKMMEDFSEYDAQCVVFTGFHPHTIRKPKFGYVDIDMNNEILDVKEKTSFTDNPENENASSGIYGFKSKNLLMLGIHAQKNNLSQVAGEFYVSLAVNELVKMGRKVSALFTEKFACWGTPEDLEDFNQYSEIQKIILDSSFGRRVTGDTKLYLAGGRGLRSKKLTGDYKSLLTLKEEDNSQLWSRSAGGISNEERFFLIAPIEVHRNIFLPLRLDCSLTPITIQSQTSSACETALVGLKEMTGISGVVSMIATDNLMCFMENIDIRAIEFDLLVWLAVRYPIADLNSKQYSWALVSDTDRIEKLSIKNKPVDGQHWFTITGNFSFKSHELATNLIEEVLLADDGTRELHLEEVVDVAIKQGLKVKAFMIPQYMSVGVPDEIILFNYLRNGVYADI